MKPSKKAKNHTFINLTPNKQNHLKQNSKFDLSTDKKQKLIHYRDYLKSLKNIDLGSLIQKNARRKKQSSSELTKNIQSNIFSFDSKASKVLNQNINFRQNINEHSSQQNKDKFNKNPSKDTHMKQKEVHQKITEKKRIQVHQNPQLALKQKNKMREFMIQNLSNQEIKQNFEDADLLCDENMDDLMSPVKIMSPRLIHLPSFSEQISRRSSSLKHSSRYRQMSMPSIEQRARSEESQENQEVTEVNEFGFACENYNQRKHNSYDQRKGFLENKDLIHRYEQKSSEVSTFSELTQAKNRINNLKVQGEQKLNSTYDTNAYSSTRSSKSIKHQNIETTPFSLKLDFKQQKKIHKKKDEIIVSEKSTKKMSLNVAEIVKRINSRESKSSMSDRSYRSKLQKTRKNSDYQQDFFNDSIDPIKSAKISIPINYSTVKFGTNMVKLQQERKRLSLKMQIKQFREKNLSTMRLCE